MIPLQTKAKYLLMAIRLSAKNALLIQTWVAWRDRKPSIFIPQGELCPPEDAKSAQGSLPTRSGSSLPCGLCARKMSADIFSKTGPKMAAPIGNRHFDLLYSRLRRQADKKISPELSFGALVSGGFLLSRTVASQVPSALRGLTSVFGMGTGGTLLLSSPELMRFRAFKTAQ